LGEGGRLILPIGDAENQELQMIERRGGELRTRTLEGCRFVPLVGFHGRKDSPAR
jgi:protein-L-isoaspartate(D-aspartate) O-methyltransferase